MKEIWYEESRLQYQMDVESALARAHASLGTITKEDAEEITRVANLSVTKIERVKEIESETRHDVMAMVKAMTEQCKGDAGKFVHYGSTSNDIVDTATALLMPLTSACTVDVILFSWSTVGLMFRRMP